jgi:hypothetical protein
MPDSDPQILSFEVVAMCHEETHAPQQMTSLFDQFIRANEKRKRDFKPECLGRSVQTAAADAFVASLLPVVEAIRSTGSTTLEAITEALNQRGIWSARGGKWHVSSVSNLLVRAHKFAQAQ